MLQTAGRNSYGFSIIRIFSKDLNSRDRRNIRKTLDRQQGNHLLQEVCG